MGNIAVRPLGLDTSRQFYGGNIEHMDRNPNQLHHNGGESRFHIHKSGEIRSIKAFTQSCAQTHIGTHTYLSNNSN